MTNKDKPKKLPRHLAIIMDGNGRWAKRRFMPRIMGHRQGAKAVKEIVTAVRELNIPYLTLYAFSKENWSRPREEVEALMNLLYDYLQREVDELLGNKIRLRAIGELHRLPPKVRRLLFETMEKTAANYEMQLILALSYGSRSEIVEAARKIAQKCVSGELDPAQVDEELFASFLYTADIPDPDLIIRTSGEQRLSNFLLYQAAYSEFYMTETLWPDFDRNELMKALHDFSGRERRFGKTSEQILLRCTGNES
ncbi:MAG: isoprenyl transferase [Thermodesulfobacteria bacterium]|nr:isoprenyl transferase [Thermodesulfobacteriota bacterium]